MSRDRYAVRLPGEKKPAVVWADYVVIEQGALVFRNNPEQGKRCPELVAVFAPGFWKEAGREI